MPKPPKSVSFPVACSQITALTCIPSKAKVKFEFVEEKQHPDYALLGDVLDDIKKRTSGLIAERKQLTAENCALIDRVSP